MGFKQGLVDPCLFFRNGIVLVIYIDDCLIFTPEKQRADTFIKELEKRFTIEDKGDITNYLGINIMTPDADTIQMVQPAMIYRIIDTLGLKNDRQHDTPADPNVKLHMICEFSHSFLATYIEAFSQFSFFTSQQPITINF